MPPRKKKRKAKTPKSTQRQSQRQSVVVNIGSSSKSKPRKSSGRGGLPPPSHMHNLAPTFVTAPQVDYTPLLAMMQHHASPIVAQAPMPVQNPTTPLSSATIATNTPSQMAGEAALRRAGRTADNFQAPPSLSRSPSVPEMVASLEAREVTAAVAQPAAMFEESLIKKGMGIGRAVGEKNVEKKVSQAQERGAAEERLKLSRERQQDAEKELMGRENLRTGLRRFNDTFSQRAEALNPMDEAGKDKLRTEFKQKNISQFSGFSTLRDLTKDAQDKLRKKRVQKPATPKPKPLKKQASSEEEVDDL